MVYAATNANFRNIALEPTSRWLIAAALDGATLTYGEIKRRLESDASFSPIFPVRIGFVAGSLMSALQTVDPKAPLINILVVNQADGQPSEGAGEYMALRFRNPQLAKSTFKEHHPNKWKEYTVRAAAEVYAYPLKGWVRLYKLKFDRDLTEGEIQMEREKRQEGQENDFGAGANKYGSGGENELHRALRIWVTENPGKILRAFKGARTQTEFPLDSGDRVDAVYHADGRVAVVEVKSRISNAIDLRRGVFQCIKYRAVKAAMDVREDVQVDAVLVTEDDVPGEIAALLKKHDILHRRVPQERN